MNFTDRVGSDSDIRDLRLDSIVDQFETGWLDGTYPPDIHAICETNFKRFCIEEPDSGFPFSQLVFELVLVDLELRWRKQRPHLRRGTNWYRGLLFKYGLDQTKLEDLAVNEMEIRSRWGDEPRLTDLAAEQFPNETLEHPAIVQLLKNQLELRMPILCNVSSDVAHQFGVNLKTPCIVGRQRSSDPRAKMMRYCTRDNMWRIIVVDQNTTTVSRRQLTLDRVSARELAVTPIDDEVRTYLSNKRLKTNERIIFKIPSRGTTISFGGISLHFQAV